MHNIQLTIKSMIATSYSPGSEPHSIVIMCHCYHGGLGYDKEKKIAK